MPGPDGVKAFERSRRVPLTERWTTNSLHAGRQSNEQVEVWLAEPTSALRGMTELIHEMLQIEPDDCLSTHQVTHRLRFWAVESQFICSEHTLDGTVLHGADLNMLAEKERLLCWAATVGISGSANLNRGKEVLVTTDDNFHRTFRNLWTIEDAGKVFNSALPVLQGLRVEFWGGSGHFLTTLGLKAA